MKKRNDVKGLIKELGKTNSLEQLHSIQALGELRAVEAVEPLVTLLRIENNAFFPSVIGPEIVKALTLIHDPRAIPTIIQGLYHPPDYNTDITIRNESRQALPMFGNAAIKPLFEAVQDRTISIRYREDVADLLHKIGGNGTIDLWIDLLKTEWSDTQQIALSKLKLIKDNRAVDPLIAILNNPKAHNRELAVEVLGDIGNVRAVDALITAIRDHNIPVQKNAILALIKINDPRAREPLIELFLEGDKLIRYEATCAMHLFGDHRAVPRLCEWLTSAEEETRCAAANALSSIGDAEAVKNLIEVIGYPDKRVRLTAANALANFYRSGKLPLDQQNMILTARPKLEEKHSDYINPHQDVPGCLDPHSDISETHIDKGIGIQL
jgi:HEAT repeat protein